jgi:hypothetical protein
VKYFTLTRVLTSHSDLHSHQYQYEEGKKVHFFEPKYLIELATFTRSLFAYWLSTLKEAFCEMLSHFLDDECRAYHLVS